MAHPPRSNPPLRSSSGPPSPCITPSTETFMLTVSLVASDRSAIAHLLFREHFRLSMVARPPTFSPSCSPDKRFEKGPSRQFFGARVPAILATAMCSGSRGYVCHEELLRTPFSRTSQNNPSTHSGE